jgi:hypothetical protein
MVLKACNRERREDNEIIQYINAKKRGVYTGKTG